MLFSSHFHDFSFNLHIQLLFNKRVAETLNDAGNDVTMVLISPIDDRDISDVKIKSGVKGISIFR